MSADASSRSKWGLYIVLALVLLGCLWVGWRDFDPWTPQDEVRENIRWTIRRGIQALVQYVIPGAILIVFGKEALTRPWGKQRTSGSDALT